MVVFEPAQRPRRAKPKKTRKVGRHALRDKLVKMITSGRIAPGEKIVQLQLCRRFGVSMSLMREALFELQTQGLVETDDNRGFFVRQFDASALLDLFEVREALEGMAARKACQHLSQEQIAELRGLIEAMCAAEAKGDHEARAECDREFHDRINVIAGNRAILGLTRQCSLFGKMIWTDTTPERLRAIHTKIVDALVANEPDVAEAAAREHVREGRRLIEQRLQEGGHGIYWLATDHGH
jgi:DNA-binding GntR family transcriptional regulator